MYLINKFPQKLFQLAKTHEFFSKLGTKKMHERTLYTPEICDTKSERKKNNQKVVQHTPREEQILWLKNTMLIKCFKI